MAEAKTVAKVRKHALIDLANYAIMTVMEMEVAEDVAD